ncbi:probable ATP-dependent RNA helicase DDX17 [Oppia nitens]|uniref:probable ATP-dependent RNA helicase DDX17 n=1 Tax=Oppia nitens TaxID=1686743 RepID=UPI0023DA7418|nr:probable ATP-dependent RNA helicase DDX17 [Oppia nitens]
MSYETYNHTNGYTNGYTSQTTLTETNNSDHTPYGLVNGLNGTNGLNLYVDPKIDAKEFWRKYDITVHGREAPLPIMSMESYKWPQRIAEALAADSFTSPTPIQCQSWPIALTGRDLVGVAQTGSGKTLCYVMPAFIKIMRERPQKLPKCLILAPTRELAQQIQEVVRRYRFANNVCLYGGASRGPQLRQLREMNPQIIIATPGRLNDFLESRALDIREVNYLVLDEADRMLDMGFEPQLKRILSYLPRERQTLMWSATWPKEVRELATQYMNDYIQINVGGTELSANKNIKQHVEVCEEFDKKSKLFELLKNIRPDSRDNKTIIFAETKRKVNELDGELTRGGWPSACIHGDKPQFERDWVLKDFKSGRKPILVATDVAARGLDVDDIKYVINYDYPNSGEDYVHRIGRTGRRDRKGTAYTFFTSENAKQAKELIEVLREAQQTVEPKLYDLMQQSRYMGKDRRRRYGGGGGRGGGGGGAGRMHRGGGMNGGAIKRKFDDHNDGPTAKRQQRGDFNRDRRR